MSRLLSGGQTVIDMAYRLMGVSHLLLSPPVDNARNVADFGLFNLMHKVRHALSHTHIHSHTHTQYYTHTDLYAWLLCGRMILKLARLLEC